MNVHTVFLVLEWHNQSKHQHTDRYVIRKMNSLTRPFVPPQKKKENGDNKLLYRKPLMNGLKTNNQTAIARKRTIDLTDDNDVSVGTNNKNQTNQLADRKMCSVLYRKKTNKKNKSWGLDGYGTILSSSDTTYDFQSHKKLKLKIYNTETGNFIATLDLIDDNDTYIGHYGNFEFQFSHYLTSEEDIKQAKEVLNMKYDKSNNKTDTSANSTFETTLSDDLNDTSNDEIQFIKKTKVDKSKFNQMFVIPVRKGNTKKMDEYKQSQSLPGKPLFDKNNIPNALVMKKKNEYSDIDVVVDPLLSKILRPHQRQGVEFMYNCVMNVVSDNISGCLLADEMGLGKTLMSITLIWTLLKQSSTAKLMNNRMNDNGEIKKVLIVCPVTLINNWKTEFKKWLDDKVGVKVLQTRTGSNAAENDRKDFESFMNLQKVHQVCIISYEKILSLKSIFEQDTFRDKIDMLICDEAHKLKNNNSKILQILKNVDFKKKILLTGTPIQNDLQEFFTICDFLNPGILGTLNSFKKNYIVPISKARNTESRYNKDIVELGEQQSEELINETSRFILRRTNDILNKFLPPKRDYIVFCKPTEDQLAISEQILNKSDLDTSSVSSAPSFSLGLITLLKKICNTPKLLQSDTYYQSNLQSVVKNTQFRTSELDSGKLRVLDALLAEISSTTTDKIVIISNYTQTLDIVQDLLKYKHRLPFVRLDGSISGKERPALVKEFNTSLHVKCFLLSAKSGGMGLNLIGGNRLILFDNDWNPAIDQQAMGRVHRDGQKKECFIYRLVTAGMIDEKILQRQVTKINLSKKILNDQSDSNKNSNKKNNSDIFNTEDLKDLFTIKKNTRSNTHDLICDCVGDGRIPHGLEDDTEDQQKDFNSTEVKLSSFISGNQAESFIKKVEEKENFDKKQIMKQCFKGFRHFDLYHSKDHKLLDPVLNNIKTDDITFILEK